MPNIPDLSKLRDVPLPAGVAEQLGRQQRVEIPVVKSTTLIGQIGILDEIVGDNLLRVIRVMHGLPQGSEVTEMRLPMAGAIQVARDLVDGTGYRVVHDPDAEVTAAAEAAATSDQVPTLDSMPPDGGAPADAPGIDQAGVGDDDGGTDES